MHDRKKRKQGNNLFNHFVFFFLDLLENSLKTRPQLFEFILDILSNPYLSSIMSWEGTDGQFVIIRPDHLAQLWGERNGRRNMTYQKFSRALRYYYHKKVLTKIRGQKYTYRFNLQELERQYGYTDILPLAISETRGNGGRMTSPSRARIYDVLPASSHVMKFASHEIPDTPFEPFVYSHCFPFFFDFNQD